MTPTPPLPPKDADGVPNYEEWVDAIFRIASRTATERKLQEAERERDGLRAWKTATHEQWAAWTHDDFKARAEAAEAREKALREALENILEHDPPEIAKDDFAYDRLKAAYRDCARAALATADQGASK